MKLRWTLSAAAAVLCLSAAACANGPGDADPVPPDAVNAQLPAESPSIIGEVKEVEGGGDAPRILVEQVPTRSAGFPVAWIDLPSSARIYVRRDGYTYPATAADIAPGARVQAWFTGPVRESYPVQATAGTVVVER